MLSTEIVSDIQNNFCAQHVLVLPMFCKKKSFWQRFTCTQLLIKKLINFPDYIFSVFSFLGQISARICLHQPLQGVYSGREPYRLHGHFLRIWSHVMSTGTFQSLDYRRPNTLALKPTDVSFFWSKPSIRDGVLRSGMLLYLHHINFKIFFHLAKFDNFKDEKISDFKTVSVSQRKNLLDWKLVV